MVQSNRIPQIALALLVLAAVYLAVISGEPRMADGGLSGTEMHWAEKLFAFAVPAAMIATVVIGAVRASRAGSLPWVLGCIFIWPLSLVYTLLVNRGHEA